MGKTKHGFNTFLILIGAALVLISISLPMLLATVIVDTYPPNISSVAFHYGSYASPTSSVPLSIDPSAPSALVPNAAGQVEICIYEDYLDESSVSLKINGISYALKLERKVLSSGTLWFYRYLADYTTPSTDGASVTFEASAKDLGGLSTTRTCYGKTVKVDGYFTINGIKITSTEQTVYLSSRKLNFEFIATYGGSYIDRVIVSITKADGTIIQTLALSKVAADKWTGSYTLEADGKYIVKGYFDTYPGRLQRMSLLIDTGSAPSVIEPSVYFPVLRWTLAGLGLGLIAGGLYARKRR